MVDLSAMCIGDKVRVIPDLIPNEEGGDYRIRVDTNMKRFAGGIYTIKVIEPHNGRYICIFEEDDDYWYWSEDMLEPVEQVSLMNLLNEC